MHMLKRSFHVKNILFPSITYVRSHGRNLKNEYLRHSGHIGKGLNITLIFVYFILIFVFFQNKIKKSQIGI